MEEKQYKEQKGRNRMEGIDWNVNIMDGTK